MIQQTNTWTLPCQELGILPATKGSDGNNKVNHVVAKHISTMRTGDLQNCRASEKRQGFKTKTRF